MHATLLSASPASADQSKLDFNWNVWPYYHGQQRNCGAYYISNGLSVMGFQTSLWANHRFNSMSMSWADGQEGPATITATKSYQAQKGISQSGCMPEPDSYEPQTTAVLLVHRRLRLRHLLLAGRVQRIRQLVLQLVSTAIRVLALQLAIWRRVAAGDVRLELHVPSIERLRFLRSSMPRTDRAAATN